MKICVCISDNGKTKNKRLSFLNEMPVLREREGERERERDGGKNNFNNFFFLNKVCRLVQQNAPLCVPSDSVIQSATVNICPLCCTWFDYYEQ